MAIIYTANVTSFGGRNGKVRSDDGQLELNVRPPGFQPPASTSQPEETATEKSPAEPDTTEAVNKVNQSVNPELLFAGAYSACFDSALQSIIRAEKAGPIETTVRASVSLDKSEEGKYGLVAALEISMPGVDRELATSLMHKAHNKCPYSLAIKGNVDVTLGLV